MLINIHKIFAEDKEKESNAINYHTTVNDTGDGGNGARGNGIGVGTDNNYAWLIHSCLGGGCIDYGNFVEDKVGCGINEMYYSVDVNEYLVWDVERRLEEA